MDYEHLYKSLYYRVQYHNDKCKFACELRHEENSCCEEYVDHNKRCLYCPLVFRIDDTDMLIP